MYYINTTEVPGSLTIEVSYIPKPGHSYDEFSDMSTAQDYDSLIKCIVDRMEGSKSEYFRRFPGSKLSKPRYGLHWEDVLF